MKGRKPIPTHLKLVTGNRGKRALPKNEPKPKRQISAPPVHLSLRALAAWGRFAAILDRMGVLTEADPVALERAVECYATVVDLEEVIALKGRTYETISTTGGVLVKARPEVAMLADADRRLRNYLTDFGMSPAARVRVHGDPEQGKDDPLSEFG